MPRPIQNSSPRVRFDAFEFDFRTGELWKHGLSIRLQEQPARILKLLLSRPGELVSRDEIRRELWPDDVYVDHEHGLHRTINKLRDALSDSAAQARFIETRARGGYRFVAPITLQNRDSSATAEPATTSPQTASVRPMDSAVSRESPEASRRGYRHGLTRAGVTGAVLLTACSIYYLNTRPLPLPKVSTYDQVSNDAQPKISPRGYVPMATDGARLYYSESSSFRLIEVSSSGGESTEVPSTLPSGFLLDISPDHTRLLVQDQTAAPSQMPFWALPLVGGTIHRLGDVLGKEGSWSPDGHRLAFSKGNELFLATAEGTEIRKLALLPGEPEWIRWSPDASKLRFTVQDIQTDSRSLWEIAADGANVHPLLPSWRSPSGPVPGDIWTTGECCGNWSADGKYFFFQSTRGGRIDIWLMSEKVGLFHSKQPEPIRLTSGALNYSSPVPSLDGTRLFVVGSQPRGELQRFDIKSQQFISYLSGISAEGIDFSRDDQWITYVAYPEGTLWRSKMDGSERLQLTWPPLRAFLPRWSPDRSKVAFAGKLPGKPYNIYVVSADNGAPEQLTNGQHHVGDVGWSADGKQLVFGDMSPLSDPAIHLLNLQTKKTSILPGSEGLFSPRWSPDGRYVAAIPVTPQDRIVLFDFETKRWSDLAKVIVGSPSWSKDSKYLYFDTQGRWGGLNRVRLSDHKVERFTSLEHVRQAPVWWTGVTPDGSPLILRDIGTEEIYALGLQFR